MHAQPTRKSSGFAITPHLGAVSESSYLDNRIVFADGDVDFISVEPGTAFLIGVELSYAFSPKLEGVLGLSFATANARYIENNDLRADVGFDTLRLQLGVMANVVRSKKAELQLGGGLTLYQTSVDGLVWNDRRFDSGGAGLGLFGAAALDLPLTPRLSFHSHLALELSRAAYGGVEDDIARADGEAGADVNGDTRTGLALVIGLRIGL